MRQQALAAGPVLAPPGKAQRTLWTTLFAPQEVCSGAALTPCLSQTETPVPVPLPPAAPSRHRRVGVN